MIVAECVYKNRDKNNNIISYRLRDKDSKELDVPAKDLKQAIMQGKIEITNLKIDKSGRLIDKSGFRLVGLDNFQRFEEHYIMFDANTFSDLPAYLYNKKIDYINKFILAGGVGKYWMDREVADAKAFYGKGRYSKAIYIGNNGNIFYFCCDNSTIKMNIEVLKEHLNRDKPDIKIYNIEFNEDFTNFKYKIPTKQTLSNLNLHQENWYNSMVIYALVNIGQQYKDKMIPFIKKETYKNGKPSDLGYQDMLDQIQIISAKYPIAYDLARLDTAPRDHLIDLISEFIQWFPQKPVKKETSQKFYGNFPLE